MINSGGFLTSLRQNTGRDNSWKLDETYLESEVQSVGKVTGGRTEPVDKEARKCIIKYIGGQWIEGERWFKVVSPNQNVNLGLAELPSEKTKGQKISTDLRREMPLVELWAVRHEKLIPMWISVFSVVLKTTNLSNLCSCASPSNFSTENELGKKRS
jgi:hypothetical protein